jgi:hypothetical protein
MTAIAILAGDTTVAFLSGRWVLKIAPTIHRNMLIKQMPMSRGLFLPKRSTPSQTKILVVTILTIP